MKIQTILGHTNYIYVLTDRSNYLSLIRIAKRSLKENYYFPTIGKGVETSLLIPVPGKTDRLVHIERTMVLAKTTLRPYISITLSYAEKGVVTQDEVVNRFHRALKCKS